jgi:hypothetical protein
MKGALRTFQICILLAVTFALLAIWVHPARGQQPNLREWFNGLSSPAGGICCHNFDGISLEEDSWRTANGSYEVYVHGVWIVVPPMNVVTVPNRLGRAHLWLRTDGTVRCFIPGSLS